MKPLILTLVICLSTFGIANAQTSDYEAIAKTVNYYLEGGTNNDFETLKKAFHHDAKMKYIRGEDYTEVNAIEFFEKAIKPGPKQQRITKIEHINISGNAANARLRIDYPNFYFVDYMNLLKIDGEWKIVNKIFHRQSKK
ncbi:nuclear transport factor 2 family protein [Flagellimonas meridianipacifica]|uniref:Putative lumazine-binding protein n=1 Tax=Flagellimonas meridianipacifica TaxID=1080225 RepID=A0A2T0MAX6_9FLAO|nr:nuclear transport factor 2 family protein [Allomuricauda pacifica]PRX54625.1 putative lumazine-binding protein [Allomuricauda pacifica]